MHCTCIYFLVAFSGMRRFMQLFNSAVQYTVQYRDNHSVDKKLMTPAQEKFNTDKLTSSSCFVLPVTKFVQILRHAESIAFSVCRISRREWGLRRHKPQSTHTKNNLFAPHSTPYDLAVSSKVWKSSCGKFPNAISIAIIQARIPYLVRVVLS